MSGLLIEKISSPLSPWEIYQSVYRESQTSFFLDSAQIPDGAHGYSYIGLEPFLEVKLAGTRVSLSGAEAGSYPVQNLLPLLRRLFRKYQGASSRKVPFFTGGAVGIFAYELAAVLDPKIRFRKKPGTPSPLLHLGFFYDVLVYDHRARCYWVVSSHPEKRKRNESAARMKKMISSAAPSAAGQFSISNFRPDISEDHFKDMVVSAKAYIAAGDIYQANLSQRFSFRYKGSPLRLYGALREINPSPFASFLNFGGVQVISSSPERLISRRGKICQTRPIAGTRPRSVRIDPKQIEMDLLRNEKERAEHIMLVDLERNDLGRVCDYRSVRVDEFMAVERYSHVIHIVSAITGKLMKGKDSWDLIRAMFPGGTITGCPKIRCMQIIDELEPSRRGIYTGSIGYIGFSGDLDLNIVIRTLVLEKGRGYFQAGAGIVHDSNPDREYQETLHKGEALAEALAHASL